MGIPKDLIIQYKKRLIKRKDIAKITKISDLVLVKYLHDAGCEIWDARYPENMKLWLKIYDLYTKEKVNRLEIAKRLSLGLYKINMVLNAMAVERWDKEIDKAKSNKKLKSNFWKWVVKGDNYAKMIVEMNK